MNSSTLIDRLVSHGIIHTENEVVQLSRDFLKSMDEYRMTIDDLDDNASEETISRWIPSNVPDDTFHELIEVDPEFVACYWELDDRIDDLSTDELVQLTVVLTRGLNPGRSEGVPDAFLPISGEKSLAFLGLLEAAIVYVWREDCEPCDLMKGSFDEVLPSPADAMPLFAVYGPNCAKELYERFDVRGAPATLFMKHGQVDTRLYGAHYSNTIESEVEILRSMVQNG